MRHFKHYCKIIFSTIAVVLVFACNSLVAHADPLTGAMLGSMLGSGWSLAGFGSMFPGAVSDTFGDFFVDLVPWDTLITTGKAYITIRNLIGSNNVSVELSPDLSSAGESRSSQFATHYNLSPGQIKQFGTIFSLGNYSFINVSGSNYLYGSSLGSIAYGSTAPFNVLPFASLIIDSPITPTDNGSYHISFPSSSQTNKTLYKTWVDHPVCLAIGLNSSSHVPSQIAFCRVPSAPDLIPLGNWTPLTTAGISVSSASPSVTAQTVVEADGRSNSIVLPASALEDITYTDGESIFTEEVLRFVLDTITQYAVDGEVVSSTYVDTPAPPTPVPTETVSETLWDDFTDFFTESFGDIYDGIIDFKESFGDWVDDVASGWTEVFGDIYSDVHDFKESFGDWVDDVASGWTEVFGDIYSTVSGISSTVSGTIANTLSTISSAIQSIVQSIENADFGFVDAFWKNFLAPFNSLFNTIKSHLSIWHYVVEWLASISSVFTFYLGVFSGAGSGFLLPIYACFAGTVVIAVYKRFGK